MAQPVQVQVQSSVAGESTLNQPKQTGQVGHESVVATGPLPPPQPQPQQLSVDATPYVKRVRTPAVIQDSSGKVLSVAELAGKKEDESSASADGSAVVDPGVAAAKTSKASAVEKTDVSGDVKPASAAAVAPVAPAPTSATYASKSGQASATVLASTVSGPFGN